MSYVTGLDWILAFLIIVSIFLWAQAYVGKRQEDILLKKYFQKGLYLKIFGAIAFTVYHAYIYGGGDTFGYYKTGQTLTKLFFNSPVDYFKLTFTSLESNFELVKQTNWLWHDAIMWESEANYFSSRLAGFIEIFTFQTYLPTCIMFSMVSYWGIWKCFRFFNHFFPNSEKIMAISFLFFPTLVFWGSGLGKDSISLGAICGMVVCAYQIFIFREKVLKNVLGFILTLYVLFIVKAYIPIAFLLPLSLSVAFSYFGTIKSGLAKVIVFPVLLILLGGFAFLFIDYIQSSFLSAGMDSFTEKILASNQNLQAAGSAFDLGIKPENINSIADMGPFFPKAVIATWYRPWLWEAKNPAMLLSAFEGTFLTVLTIIICFRGFFVKTIYTILSNSILFSLFFYCIIFSGLIGLSTSNFGTLVRYKIPMLPFLVLVMLMTNKILKEKKLTTIIDLRRTGKQKEELIII